jgi:adenylate kinase
MRDSFDENGVAMRIVILGPPGVGKGTQAKRIAAKFDIPPISTGDIFRANVQNRTELGLLVDVIMKAGKYVPDELTNDLVRNRLQEADCHGGFLLDGYPRTSAQVDELDSMLTSADHGLDAVLELTAPVEVLVDRLLKRAHTDGRDDDTEDVIRHRLDVYNEQTAPLVHVYSDRGLLLTVDGTGEMDHVTERLLTVLDNVKA